MNCDALVAEYDCYALGISEEPELSAMRDHLASGCPVCIPGVRDAAVFVAGLGAGVKLVDPPARLRRRVSTMTGESASGTWVPWLAGLAAALALAAVFVVTMTRASSHSEEALSLLRAGDVRQLAVQQPDSRVVVFSSPTRGVLLLAANFQPAAAGKTYELWLIAKNARPAPAGLFSPQRDGSVLHMTKPLGQPLAAVAVTVEPAGGSGQPTTKPFLVATP